jgi:hypothetical protein
MPMVEPDSRFSLFVRMNEQGYPVPLTHAHLIHTASSWPRTTATPSGIAALLRTSRSLYMHSYFVYEFAAVAVAWSLMAVEGALKERLGVERKTFEWLINEAVSQSLLPEESKERLHAGRKLRNSLSHPTQQTVYPFGMSEPAVASSHAVVADLYSDEPQ